MQGAGSMAPRLVGGWMGPPPPTCCPAPTAVAAHGGHWSGHYNTGPSVAPWSAWSSLAAYPAHQCLLHIATAAAGGPLEARGIRPISSSHPNLSHKMDDRRTVRALWQFSKQWQKYWLTSKHLHCDWGTQLNTSIWSHDTRGKQHISLKLHLLLPLEKYSKTKNGLSSKWAIGYTLF